MSEAGFLVCHGLFRRAEMARVVESLEQSQVARSKAGARHVLQVQAVRTLATDARLAQIASEQLGAKAFPFRATLFDKSLTANWLVGWHQDTALPIVRRSNIASWGPWTTKAGVLHAIAPASALQRIIALRVHLDDSTTANGPLRVLPGTHRHGILDRNRIGELMSTIHPVECVTETGGVVAMRPLIVHASSKARIHNPRRVVHIEYATNTQLDDGVELAVE